MMELDPERKLWVPGRRRFIFLGLGALAAAALGGDAIFGLTSVRPDMQIDEGWHTYLWFVQTKGVSEVYRNGVKLREGTDWKWTEDGKFCIRGPRIVVHRNDQSFEIQVR